MTLIQILRKLYAWGPLLFGVGFVAPVLAQSLERTGVTPPMGLSALQTGLFAGVLLGGVAKARGRWV